MLNVKCYLCRHAVMRHLLIIIRLQNVITNLLKCIHAASNFSNLLVNIQHTTIIAHFNHFIYVYQCLIALTSLQCRYTNNKINSLTSGVSFKIFIHILNVTV